MCDRAPFLGISDVHDFGYGTEVGAVPNLETPSVAQQEQAPNGKMSSNLDAQSENESSSLERRSGA